MRNRVTMSISAALIILAVVVGYFIFRSSAKSTNVVSNTAFNSSIELLLLRRSFENELPGAPPGDVTISEKYGWPFVWRATLEYSCCGLDFPPGSSKPVLVTRTASLALIVDLTIPVLMLILGVFGYFFKMKPKGE